jgi:hypothetical protein
MARHQDEPQLRMRLLRAAINLDGERFLRILRAAGDPDERVRRQSQQSAQGRGLRVVPIAVDAVVLDVAGRDDMPRAEALEVVATLKWALTGRRSTPR